ncbi:MAG: hypothetical protein CENE_02398 [Candidatus Celerinatantimonas neptuna]|nr:MAG: hypothetical protein CENE_02398 [Candidatus Celerinatantimonas neptuna]
MDRKKQIRDRLWILYCLLKKNQKLAQRGIQFREQYHVNIHLLLLIALCQSYQLCPDLPLLQQRINKYERTITKFRLMKTRWLINGTISGQMATILNGHQKKLEWLHQQRLIGFLMTKTTSSSSASTILVSYLKQHHIRHAKWLSKLILKGVSQTLQTI